MTNHDKRAASALGQEELDHLYHELLHQAAAALAANGKLQRKFRNEVSARLTAIEARLAMVPGVQNVAASGHVWAPPLRAQDVPASALGAKLGRFISFTELCRRVPLCPRSLREAIRLGRIPCIRFPGARRLLFHWESVEAALLRLQRGVAF